MPLFEVAILENPTKNEQDKGTCERLVYGPQAVVAADKQGAIVMAAMKVKDESALDPSRMVILVRPFV